MSRAVLALVVLAMIGSAVGAPPPPVLAPPSSVTPRGGLAMRPKRAEAHGGFVADMDCSNCHTTAGWALAASAGASGFDHDRTGFPLRGSHAQGTCSGCHTNGRKPATTCEGCHADPHEGRHDETCAECHTATAWSDVNALEQHRRTRMPLTGKHATIDCVACHRRQGGRTFSDLPTDCYACHRDRFNDQATHPNHNGTAGGPVFPRDCGQCHQTTAWSPAIANPDLLPREAIARTGGHDAMFVLSSGGHRTATCQSCHTDPRRTAVVRCDGCHEDVRRQHGGAPQPRAAVSCLRCHPRGAAR